MGDLNWCTVRHFTTIPGIDQAVANAIVRYRRTNGSFKYFDELWRVSGMNRSKYQILRRHFRVPGERPPPVGSKLPYARMTLTESMMDFVCQGQSFTSPRDMAHPPPHPQKPKAKDAVMPGSVTLNPAKGRRDEAVPMETDHMRQDAALTSPQQIQPLPLKRRLQSAEVDQRLLRAAERKLCARKKQTQLELSKSKSAGSQPRKPSFVLRTSPSGNNINLSCTIDKRILKQPGGSTSGNVTYQDNAPQQSQAQTQATGNATIDNFTESAREKRDVTSAAARRIIGNMEDNNLKLSDLVNQSAFVIHPSAKPEVSQNLNDNGSSHSDYETAVNAHQCQWKSPVYLTGGNNSELPSILHNSQKDSDGVSGGASSCSHQLSRENVLLHEKSNIPSSREKRSYISDWIDEVNEARNVGQLLKGREKVINKLFRSTVRQSIRESIKETPVRRTKTGRPSSPPSPTSPPKCPDVNKSPSPKARVSFPTSTDSRVDKSPTRSMRKGNPAKDDTKVSKGKTSFQSTSSPYRGRSKVSSPSSMARKKSSVGTSPDRPRAATVGKKTGAGTYCYKYSEAHKSSPSITVLRQKSTAVSSGVDRPRQRKSTNLSHSGSNKKVPAPDHGKPDGRTQLPSTSTSSKVNINKQDMAGDKNKVKDITSSCIMCDTKDNDHMAHEKAGSSRKPDVGDRPITSDKYQDDQILAEVESDLAKLKKPHGSSPELKRQTHTQSIAKMKVNDRPKMNSLRKKPGVVSAFSEEDFTKVSEIPSPPGEKKAVKPKRHHHPHHHHVKGKKYQHRGYQGAREDGVCSVM